jgi:hypothetical protein
VHPSKYYNLAWSHVGNASERSNGE